MLTCEACEKLLVDALYDELNSAQQKQLDGHLKHCRACRDLLAELQAASRTLDKNGLGAGRADGIHERGGQNELWDAIQPALAQADAERYRQLPRRRLVPYLTGALAMAASLLVFVFLIDPVTQTGNPATAVTQSASPTGPGNAELMNYLRRVETILMAVANAQSVNGRSVPVKQDFARDMAQQAGVLTNSREDFSAGQARLLKDIEFMLMQIANLEEGNMDEGVRLLQGYIEDNSILFRIRLINMRKSEIII